MRSFFKTFVHRGLIFSGFGPLIAGIVYLALELSGADYNLTEKKYLWAFLLHTL